jgi:hypothetical protein
MGLTVHYKLGLPDAPEVEYEGSGFGYASRFKRIDVMRDYIQPKLEQLRQRCIDLGFKEVSEIKIVEADFFRKHDSRKTNDEWSWWAVQAGKWINIRPRQWDDGTGFKLYDHAKVIKRGKDIHHYPSFKLSPIMAIGFSAWPGEGCEEMNFGMCLYPSATEYGCENISTGVKGWHWSSFCKTQYASDEESGGVNNFLRCHMSVIAILDEAKKIGFKVSVSDEGDYHKKRSVKALTKEIGEWNEMMAGFVGTIKDAMAGIGLSGEAPILNYKNFEHLEAKGAEIEWIKQLAIATQKRVA